MQVETATEKTRLGRRKEGGAGDRGTQIYYLWMIYIEMYTEIVEKCKFKSVDKSL